MPKLISGGVRITPMKKSGTLALATGSDYQLDEVENLVEDMIEFAKKEKVGISAFIPDFEAKKMVDGGWSAKTIEEVSAEREPSLMLSFRNGFPAPYLAFYDPEKKQKRPTTAKPSKYARKR